MIQPKNSSPVNPVWKTVTRLSILFFLMLASGLAQAGPWDGAITAITDVLTNDIATVAAVLLIVALGFSVLTGRISWTWAGGIVGGIVLIFGAATIADIIIGGASVGA